MIELPCGIQVGPLQVGVRKTAESHKTSGIAAGRTAPCLCCSKITLLLCMGRGLGGDFLEVTANQTSSGLIMLREDTGMARF